jgi:uncharacterized protein
MALNLRQTVTDFLKARPEERFTARELACWMFENMREACEEKRRNSLQDLASDAALLQQLVAEIGANRPEIQKRWPQVRTTETRPRRYYWTTASEAAEVAMVEASGPVAKTAETSLGEPALYPLLCRFLHVEQRLYPKRIDEKRSTNRHGPNGNKWLYPDLVAMEDIGAEWNREIRDCVRQVGAQRARLWSFEVKLLVNRSNVREVWFQAVSNSSWANFGYLVAADIQESAMKELRLLAASYGIGLIRLNAEDPSESEILIPARERPAIDWDACNRLADENTDFRDFVSWVRQFHQTDNARVGDWDLPEAVE